MPGTGDVIWANNGRVGGIPAGRLTWRIRVAAGAVGL
jgi:hypothetical protein